MKRMQYSGYDETFKKEILRSAAKTYKKIVLKVERGVASDNCTERSTGCKEEE